MKFTKKQFEELGKFYIDDFPIDDSNQEIMYELFNTLPNEIQAKAVAWGLSDSVFGDDVFEYLCNEKLNMTCEEYYKSEVADNYFKNMEYIDLKILGINEMETEVNEFCDNLKEGLKSQIPNSLLNDMFSKESKPEDKILQNWYEKRLEHKNKEYFHHPFSTHDKETVKDMTKEEKPMVEILNDWYKKRLENKDKKYYHNPLMSDIYNYPFWKYDKETAKDITKEGTT
jgi:hypothetical protein